MCYSSPIVAVIQVAFLWYFNDESMIPFIWYGFSVPGKMFAVWNGSVLNNSTFNLSYTWACPCFREIAEAIYGICGGSMLMFRSATGSLKLDS